MILDEIAAAAKKRVEACKQKISLEEMKQKAEQVINSRKDCMTDHYCTRKNGRICVPVKKECKLKIPGSVIEKSATGNTLFIEPAKVLFLNNAINHGILSPMGIQQVEEMGKSIFFLLEANPGPGLGVLLAYCIAGKGNAKSSAPGAVIIHFFGGIHEIYFPYILMNPLLLLATIAGGAAGVFTFSLMGVGLTAPASPGSILALVMMAERHCYVGLFLGVLIAAVVSFVIAVPLLKFMGKDTSLEEAQQKKDAMKKQAKGIQDDSSPAAEPVQGAAKGQGRIRKIAFACDAGMGSSAMGATVLKKKIAAAGLGGIEVIHTPVSSIPADVEIVVTHQELGERAQRSNPNAERILITNFLAAPEYDILVEDLKKRNQA